MNKATALARAAQVRATFPKGTITTTQARAMVVAMADSQVGYVSGNPNWSIYGEDEHWETDDWNGRQVYWCALFLAWVFDQCFGATAARAGIGLQTTNRNWPPDGYTATWLWLAWFRANGRWVGVDNCQSADISLQHYGRTGQESDHVELVTGPRVAPHVYPGIGGNTAPGNASAGAGVYRVARSRSVTVGIYRPDWAALVAAYNATVVAEEVIDWTAVHRMLLALGYSADETGVRNYQTDRGLTVDGIPGKNTTTALEADMATINDVVKGLAALDEKVGSAINAAIWDGPDRTVANLTPIVNAVRDNTINKLLATTPNPADGPRHKRFRYHDIQSQLLYAADGGLAAGAQIAALTAAVQELAANRGVDGDALVAAVTTAADTAATNATTATAQEDDQ